MIDLETQEKAWLLAEDGISMGVAGDEKIQIIFKWFCTLMKAPPLILEVHRVSRRNYMDGFAGVPGKVILSFSEVTDRRINVDRRTGGYDLEAIFAPEDLIYTVVHEICHHIEPTMDEPEIDKLAVGFLGDFFPNIFWRDFERRWIAPHIYLRKES